MSDSLCLKFPYILFCTYTFFSFQLSQLISTFYSVYLYKKLPQLQKILQGILDTENESNQTMKRQAVPNHRRKEKEVEINIDSAAHNQILKQQK
jgi:hypothetical protein